MSTPYKFIVPLLTKSLFPITKKQAEDIEIIPPSPENNIGIVFSHFLRDKCVLETVEAIFKHAPGIKIYIADQSIYNENLMILYSRLMKAGHEIHFVGFDAGLGRSRNYIVKQVKEPYVFWMDNDTLITEQTDFKKAIKILEEHKEIGFVGMQEYDDKELNHYEVDLSIKNKLVVYLDAHNNPKNITSEYLKCDMTVNVVMARREVFNDVLWDEDMKLAEHLDFFLSVKYKTKWKVVSIDSFTQHQETPKNIFYNPYRGRGEYFWQFYPRKWDIIGLDGMQYKGKAIYTIKNNLTMEFVGVETPDEIIKEEIPTPILPIKEEITKLDTKITIKSLLEKVSSLHIPFVLIKESCGEAIFYNETKLDTKILSIAVNTKEAKTNILQLLNINQQEMMDIEVRIFNKIKPRMYCGIGCQVPLPAMGYLVEYYKMPYTDIEKKFKENK